MKIFSLILFILIHIILPANKKKDDKDINNINKNRYDEYYYSRQIRKIMNKLGFGHESFIDKEDFKKVFKNAVEQNLFDFNFNLNNKNEKEDYENNLLNQIYNKLTEKEKDDIALSDALKIYEPNKILNAAEEIMTKLGYPDLVEKITNEVIEKDNKDDKGINTDL